MPNILPVFSPPGQIIHINYCFPAVFLLTFQRLMLAEPVQRCGHTRSLPTLLSKQESDAASIRPRTSSTPQHSAGELKLLARHRAVIITTPLIIT